MAGVSEFKRLADGLYIIAGQEITTNAGDVVGLFLKQEVKPVFDVLKVVADIRSQGGLAILAHPFKWPHLLRDTNLLKQFDAIEVFNARNNIPMPYLENFLARKAVKELNLNFIAGSDVHEGFELGQAKTIFDFSSQEANEDNIKNAILNQELRVEGREVSLPKEIMSHFSRNFKSIMQR
jgi:predicted metal-dependent phosphoesterase TrpH